MQKDLVLDSVTKPIIVAAMRLERIADKHIFEPMGLSAAAVKIMHILAAVGPQSPTQIIAITGGTKSNASQRLNFLEKKGYIKRAYAARQEDRRQIMVELTKNGLARLEKIKGIFKKKAMNLEKSFTVSELKDLNSFMGKLHRILDDFEGASDCHEYPNSCAK